jgi:hypothetical protein
MRLPQVMQFVPIPIKAAGSHRMQKRLPQMGAGALHQRDLGLASSGIAMA